MVCMIVPVIALSLPKIAIDAFWLVSAVMGALIAVPVAIVLGLVLLVLAVLAVVLVLVFAFDLLDTLLAWLARQMGKPYRKTGDRRPKKSKYSAH